MTDQPTVLVVEDIKFSREAVVSMLTRLNCQAEGAATGQEALNKLAQQSYDIVLIDLDLPDTEGITLAETIRHCYPRPDMALVALTAYAHDFFKHNALQHGMQDFLAKPLTFDSATSMLRKWAKHPGTP